MKKISFLIFVVAVFLLSFSNVQADTFNGYIKEGEHIPGLFFYKHRNDTETEQYEFHNFHKEATVYRRSTDNAFVYCIESWEPLNGATVGDYREEFNEVVVKLTSDKLNRIKHLAYFGYGYKDTKYDHTDIKWYAITQYLIWTVQAPEIEHYFVSSLTSTTPLDIFTNEINELNSMVDGEMKSISFSSGDKKAFVNNTIVNEASSNNHLGTYTITSSNPDIKATLSNNKILVNSGKVGTSKIEITKSYNNYNRNFLYYISDKYQDNIYVGDLKSKTRYFYAYFYESVINVNIKGLNFDGEYENLGGHEIGLYTRYNTTINGISIPANMLVEKRVTDKLGYARFNYLNMGDFYIKEITEKEEYINTGEKYFIHVPSIANHEYNVEILKERPKVNIKLKKYVEHKLIKNNKLSYEFIDGKDFEFGIYNEKDELINTFKTDENGIGNISLIVPFGKYYIKEINKNNIYLPNDKKYEFEFLTTQDEETDIIIDDIYNFLKKHEVIVRVIDEQHNPFKDINVEIIDDKNNLVYEGKTDEYGVIKTILVEGKYKIKQGKIDGYILTDDIIYINCNKDSYHEFINKKIVETINEKVETITSPKTGKNSNINYLYFLILSSIVFIFNEKVLKNS